MAYIPIGVRKVNGINAAFPQTERFSEKASQTFKIGVPVQFNAGYVQECATIDSTPANDPILGICTEPGNNLSSDGVAKTLTYGSVQNQSAAVLIPVGAPPNDGKMGVVIANDNVEFFAATLVTHALAATDIGSQFGLTKDGSTGQWYVDTTITAVASGACVLVTDLIDAVGTLGGRVAFVVAPARQQFRVAN